MLCSINCRNTSRYCKEVDINSATASLPLMLKQLRLSAITEHWEAIADKALHDQWRPNIISASYAILNWPVAQANVKCVM